MADDKSTAQKLAEALQQVDELTLALKEEERLLETGYRGSLMEDKGPIEEAESLIMLLNNISPAEVRQMGARLNAVEDEWSQNESAIKLRRSIAQALIAGAGE